MENRMTQKWANAFILRSLFFAALRVGIRLHRPSLSMAIGNECKIYLYFRNKNQTFFALLSWIVLIVLTGIKQKEKIRFVNGAECWPVSLTSQRIVYRKKETGEQNVCRRWANIGRYCILSAFAKRMFLLVSTYTQQFRCWWIKGEHNTSNWTKRMVSLRKRTRQRIDRP